MAARRTELIFVEADEHGWLVSARGF